MTDNNQSSHLTDIDKEVIIEFIDESIASLNEAINQLINLEKNPHDLGIINSIFRPVHSIKGNSAFFGFLQIKRLAHELETLLDLLRKKQLEVSTQLTEVLLAGMDELLAAFSRLRTDQPEVENNEVFEQLIQRVKCESTSKGAAEIDLWSQLVTKLDSVRLRIEPSKRDLISELESMISSIQQHLEPKAEKEKSAPLQQDSPPPPSSDLSPQPERDQKQAETTETRKTMRISEEHIDIFLEYVGELLVVGDMFSHLEKQISQNEDTSKTLTLFKRINETFGALSANLQKSVMRIRRVAIRPLLQRMPRIIRDIAVNKGKEIEVQIEGDDIEVDKSFIDILDAPLMHLVRNAADHGIESPDQRESAGKARKGTVSISVRETDDHIILSVQDDGKGLDTEAIRTKAVEIGLISPEAPMESKDIVDFIFKAGVSTAQTVTDISGRGVGMDVVKKALDDAGGSITVDNQPGKGCTFLITLSKSVTTQIMPGFLVAVNNQSFVFPLDKVNEAQRVEADELKTVSGKGLCTVRHGDILPLYYLNELLGKPTTEITGHAIVVSLNANGQTVGIIVDNVLGVQQVMLRTIDSDMIEQEQIPGAALLGDGSLALILDMDQLLARHLAK